MPAPIVTVGGLVSDPEGRVLLIRTHKWGDRWGIPGGKIDEGETMEAALVREFVEETGLAITDVRFVTALDSVHSPEFYKPVHMVLLNFTAHSAGGAVTLNEEAQAYAWVSPTEAATYDLNDPTRALLRQVYPEVSA
jgi:8-oxo-dGTP pyrophosphatase MutT (NUDIX family)